MNLKRYTELESGDNKTGPFLTTEELNQGWHFCVEYDGLLVGPGMCALEHCLCEIPIRPILVELKKLGLSVYHAEDIVQIRETMYEEDLKSDWA